MTMTHTATALIAEDEPLLAAGLAAELATHWPGLQIVATVGDGASAVERALALQPDVCFFDIRMPGMSGLEAAQALAEDWPDNSPFPLIVFVTAYEQFALQAFEAQAVDYIVKPVDSARVMACVQRLQRRLADRAAGPAGLQQAVDQLRGILGAGITAGAGGGGGGGASGGTGAAGKPPRLEVIQAQVGAIVHLVPVGQVLYFEAADKYVRVITPEREHLIRMPLKELAPQLDEAVFWQVHRGTVVNARSISTARRDDSGKVFLSLQGRSEKLTVSRLYAHLFKGM